MLAGFKGIQNAFKTVGVKWSKDVMKFYRELRDEGYAERNICIAMYEDKERLIKAAKAGNFWLKFMQTISRCPSSHNDISQREFLRLFWAKERDKKAVKLTGQTIFNYDMPHYTDCVYFIQGENGGPIKIGYSNDLARRIRRLQYYYKQKFNVLAVIPGTLKTEAEIHRKFARYRIKGEWFRPTPKVLEKIQLLKDAS